MLLKQCLFPSIAIICASALQRTLSEEIPAKDRNVCTVDEFKCRDNLPICTDLAELQTKVVLHTGYWDTWMETLNRLKEFKRNFRDNIVEVVEKIDGGNTRAIINLTRNASALQRQNLEMLSNVSEVGAKLRNVENKAERLESDLKDAKEAYKNLTRSALALQTQNLELQSNVSEVGSELRKVENRAERLESDLKDAKEAYKNISTKVSSVERKNLELRLRITKTERELLAAKDRATKLESDLEKEKDARRKFENDSKEVQILLETHIEELRDQMTRVEALLNIPTSETLIPRY